MGGTMKNKRFSCKETSDKYGPFTFTASSISKRVCVLETCMEQPEMIQPLYETCC